MVKKKGAIQDKMPKRKTPSPPSSDDESSSSEEEIVIRKSKKPNNDTESDSRSSESYSDSEIDDTIEYERFVAELFPKKKNKEKDRSKNKAKKYGKKHRHESSDTESSEYEQDESSTSSSSDASAHEAVVLSLKKEYENFFKRGAESESDEECDTDDEKTFMKDKFQKVETSSLIPKKKKAEKEVSQPILAESEYEDLLEMKKSLTQRLNRRPESKALKRALKNCIEEIQQLVKDSRKKNASEYLSIIESGCDNNINEVVYFKKKLSNTDQIRFITQMKEINKINNFDKPPRLALLDTDIPPSIKAIIMNKINTLSMMDPSNGGEYFKLKNWVDTALRIPFNQDTRIPISMKDGVDACSEYMRTSKRMLDECVYGLDDAKIQIMQMAGQALANPNAIGSAIALCGPPGTGKTSLIKNGIAKILGREFAFISLGGCGDASYLDGHSYTYEGSVCGLIAKTLVEKKCSNCLFMFDELDKVSDTPKGQEIINLLVHLTDSTQNMDFRDKYFADIPIDLSKCLFVFSYNDENLVNPILKDRFYRIYTKGYSPKEKLIIARQHLLPKIREQVNFGESDILLPDETIMYIVNNKSLTQDEQGVRNLKRCLEVIHTKLNLFRLTKAEDKLFAKDISMDAPTFPFTVLQKHVDILIRREDKASQSMLMMYC